jgi:hypothetical protein
VPRNKKRSIDECDQRIISKVKVDRAGDGVCCDCSDRKG